MKRELRADAQAGADAAGQRLDQVAARLFPEHSRARLQAWIRDGALTLDRQPCKPSQRLAGGEWLRLRAELQPKGELEAQDLPLSLLHEDEELLVINKPAGLVVHPAAGHPDGTLANALLHHDPGLALLPRAGIVHRLDKDTTGAMVVARTLEAHTHLVAELQARRVSRVYEAVVHGLVAADGSIDQPIGRHPRDRKRMAVVRNGKPAVSHYRVLARCGHFSHLEVALETGRTHQIRVHMQHLGHPLVGDPVYGRKTEVGLPPDITRTVNEFPRQALHARTLKLVHPATGAALECHAPVPADLQDLLDKLCNGDPA